MTGIIGGKPPSLRFDSSLQPNGEILRHRNQMLFALLAMVPASISDANITLSELGIERSRFGDAPRAGAFKYLKTHQFGGTYILYPLGRSDRRYYVFVGARKSDIQICATSIQTGKVRNLWILSFNESSRPFHYPNAGTLWNYACQGYRPLGPIPKAARADFEEIQGLAVYRLVGGDSAPFHYFVSDFGQTSETYIDWNLRDRDWRSLPKTTSPYPISEEEKRWIEFYKPIRPGQP